MSNDLTFSVITVCLNSESTIQKTIESVICQDYQKYEFIIVDGKSSDSTVEIVNQYKTTFLEKKIKFVIVSEKDRGIYDAMNKGIRISAGEYLVFLNSDDYFYNSYVLSSVERDLKLSDYPDVLVGNTFIFGGNRHYIQKPPRILFYDKMLGRMTFIHQSSFSKRELFDVEGFSLDYKVCSDYDFFFRQVLNKKRFYVSDIIICAYSYEGISAEKGYKYVREEYKEIRSKNMRVMSHTKFRIIKVYFYSFIYDLRASISSCPVFKNIYFYLKNEKK